MQPTEPLELNHSWPLLFDAHHRFDLGMVHGDGGGLDTLSSTAPPQALAAQGIGVWECDLRYNALTWSDQVYDIFGFPRHARLSRADTVALYREPSRAAMERLRSHAIRHRRGFTLDVEIQPAQGAIRRVRLMAAPIVVDNRVVRLRGLKQIIPAA